MEVIKTAIDGVFYVETFRPNGTIGANDFMGWNGYVDAGIGSAWELIPVEGKPNVYNIAQYGQTFGDADTTCYNGTIFQPGGEKLLGEIRILPELFMDNPAHYVQLDFFPVLPENNLFAERFCCLAIQVLEHHALRFVGQLHSLKRGFCASVRDAAKYDAACAHVAQEPVIAAKCVNHGTTSLDVSFTVLSGRQTAPDALAK